MRQLTCWEQLCISLVPRHFGDAGRWPHREAWSAAAGGAADPCHHQQAAGLSRSRSRLLLPSLGPASQNIYVAPYGYNHTPPSLGAGLSRCRADTGSSSPARPAPPPGRNDVLAARSSPGAGRGAASLATRRKGEGRGGGRGRGGRGLVLPCTGGKGRIRCLRKGEALRCPSPRARRPPRQFPERWAYFSTQPPASPLSQCPASFFLHYWASFLFFPFSSGWGKEKNPLF